MGNGLSFERNTLDDAPAPPAYFMQSLDITGSPLAVTGIDPAWAGFDRIVVYPTLEAYQALENLGNATTTIYQDGIEFVGDFVANMEQFFNAPPTGQAVFSGIADSTVEYYLPPGASLPPQADWSLHFTLQNGPGSLLKRTQGTGKPHPLDGGDNTTNSVYAWVPVNVPSNAVGLSFQFQLSGAGTDEYITMGVSNQNFFTLESLYIQDGAWTETTMMDVSAYAGQQAPLFYSLNSTNGAPVGQLGVRAIQFYVVPPPTMSLSLQGSNVVIAWPVTATGWQLQSTSSLSAASQWTPITNGATALNYQFVVTNSITNQAMFYRLSK
jgi:hypothetical protein